ncbi:hypothetical protein PVAND_010209 [Polypedilum vanderplanki]|uniref:Uncharacterized protein n=1 Tax=Polypedilum vanderplanki TaxID=319348 RepID=A0A9J6CFN8_POLVA|nr:hypothetical protein PVAND_010209 [Polypedilum vanderplanki]
MDVIYSLGDSFYRHSARDYEKYPLEEEYKSAQAKPKHQPQQRESHDKSHCVFCKEQKKEQKKRPLKSAIKRCKNRTDSINEEPEESK